MLIDWFTVGAQAVNFLVLAALLKHFLYGPILSAMDRREQGIADRFAEADWATEKAEAREAEYGKLLQDLDEARGDRLRQVEEEAEGHRRELLKSAREEAADLKQAWLGALRREREEFFGDLKKRVGAEVLHIARKSLLDLADDVLEQRLVKRFAALVADLGEGEREQILAAGRADGLTVRSSFPWPEESRRELSGHLREVFDQDIAVRFTTDPAMDLGIELTVGGLKFPWGVDSYFAELEKAVAELYDSRIGEAGRDSTGEAS